MLEVREGKVQPFLLSHSPDSQNEKGGGCSAVGTPRCHARFVSCAGTILGDFVANRLECYVERASPGLARYCGEMLFWSCDEKLHESEV